MAKFLKVRGSTPAHLLMGRSGIQPPRSGTLPDALFQILLHGNLDSTGGVGDSLRVEEAQYVDSVTGLVTTAATLTARFQTNPNTGTLAYLQEPEAINQCPSNRAVLTGTGWTSFYDTPGTAFTAPNGLVEATDAYSVAGFGTGRTESVANYAAGDRVVTSIYAAAVGTQDTPWLRLGFRHGNNTWTRVYFDLVNGVIGSDSGTPLKAFMEPAANGFYRVGLVVENIGTGTDNRIELIQGATDGDTTGAATSQNGQAYWGAQMEEAVYMSSVIYTTTTTAVTRDADALDFPSISPEVDLSYGAYSAIMRPLADSADIATTGVAVAILGGDNNCSYMMQAQDGGTKTDGNYQFNPGNVGATSYVSGQETGAAGSHQTWCQTYDADGEETFPGTKRFMWIAGAKYERDNMSSEDDGFYSFPTTTETHLGYDGFGSPPFPCLISDIQWWPLLTDPQAFKISTGGGT